jgi:hypothetical protein
MAPLLSREKERPWPWTEAWGEASDKSYSPPCTTLLILTPNEFPVKIAALNLIRLPLHKYRHVPASTWPITTKET